MGVKVSVVLPTYNAEKYLCNCINSLMVQTLEDIEIIIVNDGSTDKTIDIAKKLQLTDSRIVLINQTNQGPGMARNTGMKFAQGEYMCFVDPDDWIEPDMLLKMYSVAKEYNCDVVQCDYSSKTLESCVRHYASMIPSNKLLKKNEIKNYIKGPLLEGTIGTYVWDKIYKVSFLRENNFSFIKDRLFEDWHFIMNVTSRMGTFLYIDESLYNYRIVVGSLTRRYYDNYEEMILTLQKLKFEYLKLWDMDRNVHLPKMLKNLGDDVFKILHHIYNPLYNIPTRVKLEKMRKLMCNSFLEDNFYSKEYLTYIKQSGLSKLYSVPICLCLKYKKTQLLHLFMSGVERCKF